MINVEELHDKILQEMDLSKEVADDELMEVIRRVLNENGREDYYQKQASTC